MTIPDREVDLGRGVGLFGDRLLHASQIMGAHTMLSDGRIKIAYFAIDGERGEEGVSGQKGEFLHKEVVHSEFTGKKTIAILQEAGVEMVDLNDEPEADVSQELPRQPGSFDL